MKNNSNYFYESKNGIINLNSKNFNPLSLIKKNVDNEIKINEHLQIYELLTYIYKFLINDIYENKNDVFDSEPKDWTSIKNKLRQVFNKKYSIDERIELWERKLENGFFGFDSDVSYDDREWFKEAVEVIENNGEENYYKKSNFNESNWKYFHDAVTYHSFFIKNELLPLYGIVT